MRVHAHRRTPEDLRRRLLRLDGLPLRPVTARTLIASLPDEPADDEPDEIAVLKRHSGWDLDPGWVLAGLRTGRAMDPPSLIAERPWWPAVTGPASELLNRLWRHSVAVGVMAGRLAREAGDPDPESVARAGLLCGLGCWAVAAVEPEWLVAWWHQADPGHRERMERADLGSDLADLGRRLAERWGCPPLVIDAAWLHADRDGAMNRAAANPDRLMVIQQACRWAEQTPWSLRRTVGEAASGEPRLRILMAEVQARCGAPFVAPDAMPHEERATRQNARLRRELGRERLARGRAERFLGLLAGSTPGETPEEWADRAARGLCAEPGVGAARISWPPAEGPSPHASEPPAAAGRADVPPARWEERHPPSLVLPLMARGHGGGAVAELWCRGDRPGPLREDTSRTILDAWRAWAGLLAERSRLERRLQAVVASLRGRIQAEEERLRRSKLDALGEFAAGAGHELNNPLAVVVGRAQLLLARAEDPEVVRSLRTIIGQAQRAHRILRDLMFVARPPEPRPRACQPPEILRSLLADFERECAARGVRLLSDLEDATTATWADPDGLRHLGEVLLRNALQATPPGGRIQVRSSREDDELVWSFTDSGKGIGPEEAEHLFDPFFSGRQAGRGLGLGLPRAAKLVELSGGTLRWNSTPGHETVFRVHLPLRPAPDRGPEPEPPPRPADPSDGRPSPRLLKT